MNSYVQCICLIVSFIFGILLYYGNKFNIRIIRNKNILIKLILSVFYIFNMSMLYVLFLYKINSGILHIYFVLLIIIGYVFMCVKKRK